MIFLFCFMTSFYRSMLEGKGLFVTSFSIPCNASVYKQLELDTDIQNKPFMLSFLIGKPHFIILVLCDHWCNKTGKSVTLYKNISSQHQLYFNWFMDSRVWVLLFCCMLCRLQRYIFTRTFANSASALYVFLYGEQYLWHSIWKSDVLN